MRSSVCGCGDALCTPLFKDFFFSFCSVVGVIFYFYSFPFLFLWMLLLLFQCGAGSFLCVCVCVISPLYRHMVATFKSPHHKSPPERKLLSAHLFQVDQKKERKKKEEQPHVRAHKSLSILYMLSRICERVCWMASLVSFLF